MAHGTGDEVWREREREIRKRNGGREKGVRRYQDIYVGDDKGVERKG